MLTDYIRAAMHHARYEILEDDATFYGSIPECVGVWANEPTLEACREELQSALEDWILLGLRLGHTIPVIDDIDVNAGVAS
jgi:predicted RNase H-like HicB family nuclease